MNWYNLMDTTTVYATQVKAVSNASRDIILNDDLWRTTMQSIDWLTDIIDAGFATFIAVIGLFIISSALLKNVVAGAYAANPKFWDKVHAAHLAMKSILQLGTGLVGMVRGQGMTVQNGEGGQDQSTLSLFFFRLLPDFYEMSEFEGNQIRPKEYFMKAIPQMFGVVFLGIFIWNGYYRQLAAKGGDMAAVYTERILLDVDPVATIDKMFNLAAMPSFPSSLGVGGISKQQYELSRQVYSLVVSRYDDIKGKYAKDNLVNAIESAVENLLEADLQLKNGFDQATLNSGNTLIGNDLFNEDKYNITTNIQWISDVPDGGVAGQILTLPYDNDKHRKLSSGTEEFLRYHDICDIKSTFGFDSKVNPTEVMTLRVALKYSRKTEQRTTSSTYTGVTLSLTNRWANIDSNKTVTITLPEGFTYALAGGTTASIEGSPTSGQATVQVRNSTIEITGPLSIQNATKVTLILGKNITATKGNIRISIAKIYYSGTGTNHTFISDESQTLDFSDTTQQTPTQ